MATDTVECSSSFSSTSAETPVTLGFEIDTKPTGRNERFYTPDYECKRKLGESDADKPPNKRKNNFNSCWNCGQAGHSNRDCRQPVSQSNLARNRQQFLNKRAAGKTYLRYHADNEQKYAHLKPGVISRHLRKALGVKTHEVPNYIYNMRLLGYPPGWLEEAKVLHSGITLFDGNGVAVADPDDEEGEVVEDSEQRHKYDINKLVEYPGFNTPFPPHVVDKWEERNLPCMRPEHSLERLIDMLRPNEAKAYERRKVPVVPSTSPPREEIPMVQASTEDDMECEETPEIGFLPEDDCAFIPPLPDDVQPPPPPPEEPPLSLEDGECSNQSEGTLDANRKSPSLSALEQQKKSLLDVLNNTNSSDSIKSGDFKSPAIDRVKKRGSITRTPSPNLGRTKSVELGTPILKSVSPYSKLPSSESFSQNICDVINFENLPDSTGIYDKMLGVISKVRSHIKRM